MEISVLLPAYNAERFILGSVQSVLAQTYESFELLVVDDCSTDGTAGILAGVDDPRLRVLRNGRNLGIVGSLNRAIGEARGRYIARIDADDFCTPTRFAKQKRFLDETPSVALVGTEMSVLSGGRVRFSRNPGSMDPVVLRWLMHLDNPVGHPSMMFRAEVVQKLGSYLAEDMKYAEDFDFSHRVLDVADMAVLPEHLTIYRQHASNLTRLHREEMVGRTVQVLHRVYRKLFGRDGDEAGLVARYILSRESLGAADWEPVRAALESTHAAFVARYAPGPEQRIAIERHLARIWDHLVQKALSTGRLGEGWRARRKPLEDAAPLPTPGTVRSATTGLLSPVRPALTAVREVGRSALRRAGRVMQAPLAIDGVTYHPQADDASEGPPTLYVVVDTEAEFDWTAPMNRGETGVSSAAQQFLAQEIFDRLGIRPIYVVDYSIASQPEGYEPLRAFLARHGCVIGAHLHPWTTPPFEEEVTERNSFTNNLPPELEERKLGNLVAAIEASFGVRPMFFKAGRYGLSAATLEILERYGFQVDFSIIPLTDLRDRGGPDFRRAGAVPYKPEQGGITSFPMMRGQAGLLSPLPLGLHGAVNSQAAKRLRLPGILARTGLLNTATLTPEGMTVAEQVALIRTMAARGHRTFVLHYHSPSLGGHTPYVRDAAELRAFLANIEAVCGFFTGAFGGLAGNPQDLLPPGRRQAAWPAGSAAA